MKNRIQRRIQEKFGWDVSGLGVYVDEQSEDIIPALIYDGRTAQIVPIMEGVIGSKEIKLIDSSITLQTAATCGRNALGTTTLTDKQMVVKPIKSNQNFCSEDLVDTWGQLGLPAGVRNQRESLAYEDLIISHQMNKILELNEDLIWKGSLGNVAPNLNKIDGFKKKFDADATVTQIFDIDELTFGQGTLMEIADFGEYAFMTNGVIMIYWDPTLGPAGDWHEIIASATIPMMRTICNFKGQAFGGNVVGLWDGVSAYTAWEDCDETFYVWSKIGELDFTPDRKNTAGYRRDPYGGEVYHTRRLGDNVIGYSSKGVVTFSPVTKPNPTFACIELDDVGLINQGAMDGNLHRQVYVGTDYIVREVTSQGVKELGYNLYISDLTDGDIIVNYDRLKKDFYISDGTTTYLLSPYGLTQVPQSPSAVWVDMTNKDEVVMLPNTVDSTDPYLASTIFDMEYRGEKTIFSVESDALITFDPVAKVGWMNTLSVWGYSDSVPLNDQGVAAIIISGNEFIVQLDFTLVAVIAPIKYIKVRYKMTDLRGVRGVHAPPPRGQ